MLFLYINFHIYESLIKRGLYRVKTGANIFVKVIFK